MFYKKAVLLKVSQYSQDEQKKTPLMKCLFNLKYREIFKSTYYEEHLRTAASGNVFFDEIEKI